MKVKSLVWTEHNNSGGFGTRAFTGVGAFGVEYTVIRSIRDAKWYAYYRQDDKHSFRTVVGVSTSDAAKASAQTDYETTIMEAIENSISQSDS